MSLQYKKKSLDVTFLSFMKLNMFITLCNWILRNKGKRLEFSALLFLKTKLTYAAMKEGLSLKKYLLKQLYRIQTQYTLKGIG